MPKAPNYDPPGPVRPGSPGTNDPRITPRPLPKPSTPPRPSRQNVARNGLFYRMDKEPITEDEFFDKLVEFTEANGWYFGGTTTEVDLDEPGEELD